MSPTEPSPTWQFPVSVIMERQTLNRGPWSDVEWRAAGIVAGQHVAKGDFAQERIHAKEGREQYLCTGYVLELFKDGSEGYYHNLLGEIPSLFVVCYADEDEADVLTPVLVSADPDEALAHMESDDLVMSVPMPPEINQWVERYVIENYVPPDKKKRKRKNWTEESRRERRFGAASDADA